MARRSGRHARAIDEIVREGARRMLAAALEAEVNTYIAELAGQRDESGRRLVVRNGYHQPRRVTTAAGAIEASGGAWGETRLDCVDALEVIRVSVSSVPF